MKILNTLLLIAIVFLVTTSVAHAATPSVTSLNQSQSSVGRYQKFEVNFQISKTYPVDSMLPYVFYDPSDTSSASPGRAAPYGTEGISIDAHFTSPSGKTLIVPAFYYQTYTRSGSYDSGPTMSPGSTYGWMIRFAPEEIGTYRYYITITDKEGTTTYNPSNLSFSSVSSSSKGFIRVSSRDSRFWDYSNGESFVPISGARQWWLCCGHRSFDYDKTFASFKANNMNFTRIWTQNDGWGLTVEGHYDQYTYPDDFNPEDRGVNLAALPKGNQVNQRGASELDYIVQAAEANGVAMQVCAHATPYWIWESYPARDSVGHVMQWKRNMRYRIARWGYSTSVFAWETWNEEGHITSNMAENRFYIALNNYIKSTDPYKHMITTSQGSQSWSPGFWTNGTFDLANYHDYMMPGRYAAGLYNDESKFVYLAAQCLRTSTGNSGPNCPFGLGDGSTWSGGQKPIVWGELDTGTSSWNVANPVPTADHNMIWAGLFSPIGMVPIDWYIEAKSYLSQQYAWKKIAGAFFADVDYAGQNFTYLSTTDVQSTSEALSSSNNSLRVLGMRSSSKAKVYLWIQNKGYSWQNGNNPGAQSGNITVNNVANGTYKVEYWNTDTGAVTQGSNVTVSNGTLTVPSNSVSKSVAVKIISTSLPANTPTPIPTVPTTLSGDLNGDNKVDGLDFAYWKTKFLAGTMSGTEFNLWKQAFLKQ